MSTHLPERFIGRDFSVFLVLITFSLSLQKCLQISPTCIQVELDHRDLLQEDEEFKRQTLVAEIAEELY